LGSGLSCMLVKKEAGFTEKPAGVGTASGLLRTSIATVVELLTAPAGKVSEPREPKTVSFTVPPKELTVPSGVRLGWITTKVVGNPCACSCPLSKNRRFSAVSSMTKDWIVHVPPSLNCGRTKLVCHWPFRGVPEFKVNGLA